MTVQAINFASAAVSSQNPTHGKTDRGEISFAHTLEQNMVEKTAKGYAYVDKYGFSHVVAAYETAAEFVKPDTDIYGYHGDFRGGYARDEHYNRLMLPLPQAIPYGNEEKDIPYSAAKLEPVNEKPQSEEVKHPTVKERINTMEEFLNIYPGAISQLPPDYGRDLKVLTELVNLGKDEED